CASVLAQRWPPPGPRGPLVGPGGNLGAWLALYLEERFRPAGQLLILGSCLLLGLVLALDVILLRLLRTAWWLLRAAGRFRRLCRARGTKLPRPAESPPGDRAITCQPAPAAPEPHDD